MALDDHELIQYAQRGDMNAFEQLVRRHDKQVFALAARYVNNAEDAKDIYQEVFLRVYRGLKNFQGRSEFSTWLYRITTNVCLTHRSQRKKHTYTPANYDDEEEHHGDHPMTHVLNNDGSPEQHVVNSEISHLVQEALEALSPKQKLVFTLRHYQGYKLKEIASMMNCTDGTVKRYLFNATQRMRDQLKDVFER